MLGRCRETHPRRRRDSSLRNSHVAAAAESRAGTVRPSDASARPTAADDPARSRGGVERAGPVRPSDASARLTAADDPARSRGGVESPTLHGISTLRAAAVPRPSSADDPRRGRGVAATRGRSVRGVAAIHQRTTRAPRCTWTASKPTAIFLRGSAARSDARIDAWSSWSRSELWCSPRNNARALFNEATCA